MFKYRICRKCGSVAAGSENREYAYQCYGCDEDLYEFETEEKITADVLPPAVEGTREDTGFIGMGYCDETCNFCQKVTFNIPVDRVSLCAHCSQEISPCSACENACSWKWEKITCCKFEDTESFKNECGEESTSFKKAGAKA